MIDYSLLVAVARVTDGVPSDAGQLRAAAHGQGGCSGAQPAAPKPPPRAGARITLDPLEKARVLRQLQAAGGIISRDRQKARGAAPRAPRPRPCCWRCLAAPQATRRPAGRPARSHLTRRSLACARRVPPLLPDRNCMPCVYTPPRIYARLHASLRQVYFLGIIDALSQHSLRWLLQANALRLLYTLACRPAAADGITALPPAPYAERFLAFILSEVIGVDGMRAAADAGQLDARQLESVQRWKHLWVRRRHGLLRERIETERAELTMRIAELEHVIGRLHGSLQQARQPRAPSPPRGGGLRRSAQ